MRITKTRVKNLRTELMQRLLTLLRDRVQYVMKKSDDRTNSFLRASMCASNGWEELVRFITWFKSFPTVFLQCGLGHKIYGRDAGSFG